MDFSGVNWRTSTYSGNEGKCVEIAPVSDAVGVRDSKAPAHSHLAFTRAAWTAFTHATIHNTLIR